MTTPTPSADIVERWPGYDEQSWQERFAVMERKRDELREMTLRFAQIRHDEQRIHADEITSLRARVEELEGEKVKMRQLVSRAQICGDGLPEQWHIDASAAIHPTVKESRDG